MMAGDAQRRVEKLLSRLSQAASPRQKQPLISGNGIARRGTESELRVPTSSMGSNPQCRPWDRRDLMRRLATFKAMTWFGKPKTVSAVNCARRGWINVEMDVICCEACGARLLFSTPSSWNMQQVEKAAAVFSLKLDNGHKLLCPWINNSCDEKLALFPPTPAPALVDSYKERSAALLQLTALPVISSLAINYMKSPELENFLSQSFCPPVILKNGIRLTDNARSKDSEGASEDASANVYYQALKTISLCGWEPHLLPYVVDSEDQPSQSSGERLGEQKNDPIICTSDSSEVEVGNTNRTVFGESQYDPASVVLECRFCGARVGLWAFAKVQRPLESFTLTADVDGQSESASRWMGPNSSLEASKVESSFKDNHNIVSTSKGRSTDLNLTIAGGPPPTKQNFRPVVSFPLISRHLRAEFASTSNVKDYFSSQFSCGSHENSHVHSQIDVPSQQDGNSNGDLVISSEDAKSLKRKRNENELFVSESNDLNEPSCSNKEFQGNGTREKQKDITSDGKNYNTQEAHSLHEGIKDAVNSEDIRSGDSHKTDACSEGTEGNTLQKEKEIPDSIEAEETVCTTPDAEKDSRACKANPDVESGDITISQVDSLYSCETSESGGHIGIASCPATNAAQLTSDSIETGNNGRISNLTDLQIAKSYDQKTNRVNSTMLPPAIGSDKVDHALGKTLMPPLHHKMSEFDPIRQHRPFCPWIAPEDGESLPGWRLTFNALIHQEKASSDVQQVDSPTTLIDEVDDPIISIRRLFMSPPSKRLKGAR